MKGSGVYYSTFQRRSQGYATDEEFFQNSLRFTSLSDSATDPRRIGAALG